MKEQNKEQKSPERSGEDLLAERVFRLSLPVIASLKYLSIASHGSLKKKSAKHLSLYEAYLLLKRDELFPIRKIDACIEKKEVEFDLFGKEKTAYELLALLLKKEELLEWRIKNDNYKTAKERESDYKNVDRVEKQLIRLVELCPSIKPPFIDEEYRYKSSGGVASSLAIQEIENRSQMLDLNNRKQATRNKELIAEASRGLGIIAAFAAVSKEDELTFINKQFTGTTESKIVDGYSVGISSRIGQRILVGEKNEDAHLATSFTFNIGNISYPVQLFCLFDGHGGKGAAHYLEKNFEKKFKRALEKFNKKKLSTEGVWKALHWTCVDLGKELANERPRDTSGSTAAIAAIIDETLWTANVGDSRIILDNDGECEQLTEDASPGMEKYRKEIEERGGEVIGNRIIERNSHGNIIGSLGVGRVIGDRWLRGRVSSAPTVTKRSTKGIKKGKSHLILTCDGIFEQGTNMRPADIVELTHSKSDQSAELLANHITAIAWRLFSEDNLSAIVVKL